jgi:hypothetical protein
LQLPKNRDLASGKRGEASVVEIIKVYSKALSITVPLAVLVRGIIFFDPPSQTARPKPKRIAVLL